MRRNYFMERAKDDYNSWNTTDQHDRILAGFLNGYKLLAADTIWTNKFKAATINWFVELKQILPSANTELR